MGSDLRRRSGAGWEGGEGEVNDEGRRIELGFKISEALVPRPVNNIQFRGPIFRSISLFVG